MSVVAFQGEHGSYSEEAALRHFGSINTSPHRTFLDALNSVEEKRATHAIIPLENSIEGTVGESNDMIRSKSDTLRITGETFLHVRHCLIGNTDDISRIDTVYSHPQALGQCRNFVSKYRTISAYDTAGSVLLLNENNADNVAAIASEQAAAHYGKTILRKNIGDVGNNYTRFAIIQRRGLIPIRRNKTSISFTLPHKPGSLQRVLSRMSSVNLTRIVSRPDRTGEWKYVFFVDFVGKPGILDAVTADISGLCESFEMLGTYMASDSAGRF